MLIRGPKRGECAGYAIDMALGRSLHKLHSVWKSDVRVTRSFNADYNPDAYAHKTGATPTVRSLRLTFGVPADFASYPENAGWVLCYRCGDKPCLA